MFIAILQNEEKLSAIHFVAFVGLGAAFIRHVMKLGFFAPGEEELLPNMLSILAGAAGTSSPIWSCMDSRRAWAWVQTSWSRPSAAARRRPSISVCGDGTYSLATPSRPLARKRSMSASRPFNLSDKRCSNVSWSPPAFALSIAAARAAWVTLTMLGSPNRCSFRKAASFCSGVTCTLPIFSWSSDSDAWSVAWTACMAPATLARTPSSSAAPAPAWPMATRFFVMISSNSAPSSSERTVIGGSATCSRPTAAKATPARHAAQMPSAIFPERGNFGPRACTSPLEPLTNCNPSSSWSATAETLPAKAIALR
mmetsp:Transcript_42021/g.126924  ORF Transcript_42021/g.126924 Transcript_42021/m.126924 type:complete len:311 (+) Transcript_42021:221-1153(+)